MVPNKKETKILAFIGPEGGFEEWEVREACEAGFIPVTLGATKLRTETAGIVVLRHVFVVHWAEVKPPEARELPPRHLPAPEFEEHEPVARKVVFY